MVACLAVPRPARMGPHPGPAHGADLRVCPVDDAAPPPNVVILAFRTTTGEEALAVEQAGYRCVQFYAVPPPPEAKFTKVKSGAESR